ncbi:MAG: hypothetical protein Q8Q39_04060 [bacterium]|nr:hypothetical protein [bacterium]
MKHEKLFVKFLTVSLFALICAVQPAMAKMPKEILRLETYRPGTEAIGFSVFEGVEPVSFNIRLLNLTKVGGEFHIDAYIYGTPKGLDTPLEGLGAIFAMSGSPVFLAGCGTTIDECTERGTFVGALSRRPDDHPTGGPNAIITPGEYMFGARSKGFMSPGAEAPSPLPMRNAFGKETMSDAFMADIADAATYCGITKPVELKAGSLIAVFYAMGDMPIAGTGTVSWVDGNKIYMFGHPMSQTILGSVAYPFVQVSAAATIQTPLTPYKQQGCVVGNEGTVTIDSISEISGIIGKRTPTIALNVTLQNGNGVFAFREFVVPNTEITDQLFLQLPTIWANQTVGTMRFASFDYTVRVVPRGQQEIYITNTGSQNQISGMPAIVPATLAQIFRNVAGSGFQVDYQSIDITVVFRPEIARWEAAKTFLSKDEVLPGETILVYVALRKFPEGSPVQMIGVPVHIPPDILERDTNAEAPAADRKIFDIYIQSGLRFKDQRKDVAGPANIAEFIARLNESMSPKANRIYLQVVLPPKRGAAPNGTTEKVLPVPNATDDTRWQEIGDAGLLPQEAPGTYAPEIIVMMLPELQNALVNISEKLTVTVTAPQKSSETAPADTRNKKHIFKRLWPF